MTPQPTRRLRVAHVIVQPVLVWDDGTELSPGPQAQPMQVPLSELDGMADKLRAEVAAAEAQSLAAGPDPAQHETERAPNACPAPIKEKP